MSRPISGCGLGLRREFLDQVYDHSSKPEWFELVPENWIRMHASYRSAFEKIVADFPVACHGLSLSIGGDAPLDRRFLKEVKAFLDRYDIDLYTEHLSYCSLENKQLYELLPLPMTEAMAAHVADRVAEVQDILGRRIALENATYYTVPYAEMEEAEFINLVLEKSGCNLLLDVNNVFVNGFNHKFDPKAFLEKLDTSSVAYIHVAGHLEYEEDLYIDTHGTDVKQEVFDLLAWTLETRCKAPVLLERDNNIPPYETLLEEFRQMEQMVAPHGT